MKTVSVVIPVYNTAELMYTCFNSLVNQTVGIEKLDIIVVDDGSTDNGVSRNIINEYVSKYPDSFRMIVKENGGQGSARNMAFPLCTGEYITCLDSDDAFEPEWVEKMYGAAKKYNADFVGCGYKAVRYEGEKTIVDKAMDMRKICTTNREMFIDGSACMFTTLFSRDVLEKSGARYPEGHIYEDTAFYIELLPAVKKPVYVEEALSIRTLHEGSTMTIVKPEKVAHIFPVMKALLDHFESRNIREEYKTELEYFVGKVLLCSSLNRVGFVKKRKERKKLVTATREFLKENVPDFRKNPHIHGSKSFYLKHYNSFLMNVMTELLHVRFLIKKDYNT